MKYPKTVVYYWIFLLLYSPTNSKNLLKKTDISLGMSDVNVKD